MSTRDLAKYIGVTQPLLYHYYGSKENLIDCVYREVFFSRWSPEWEEVLADTTRPLEAMSNLKTNKRRAKRGVFWVLR